MEQKKQSPKDWEKTLTEIYDQFSTSRIVKSESENKMYKEYPLLEKMLEHIDSIFTNDSYSESDKKVRLDRIRSAFKFAKSNLKAGHTPPMHHGETVGRLTEVNLDEIISRCDAWIEELGRLHPTESDRLWEALKKYGFFNLEKVTSKGPDKIFNWIMELHISKKIAALDHVGFIHHLETQHCNKVRDKVYKTVAKVLPESESAIKKNIQSLTEGSTLRGGEFADIHKLTIEKEYQSL